MTLVEIVIVLAIIGILSAVSARLYDNYLHRVAVAQAKTDILAITIEITRYQWANNDELPDDLDAIGKGSLKDPWGNPYGYQNLTPPIDKPGNVRKNKNLVPINSDYDLYSKGPDGKSQGPLTAKASRDDIVRANNGRFIGVASDY
jgi:general secretion pathway protein G